jgi:hypothetical protein
MIEFDRVVVVGFLVKSSLVLHFRAQSTFVTEHFEKARRRISVVSASILILEVAVSVTAPKPPIIIIISGATAQIGPYPPLRVS